MRLKLSRATGVTALFFLLFGTLTASAGPDCCETGKQMKEHSGNSGKTEKAGADGLFETYENISAGLVADDLDRARAAAEEAVEGAAAAGLERASELAATVAEAENLDAAREAFIPLSREIVMLAAGKEGYHVMSCPMVENGGWLQSDAEVRNPYMGREMPGCGRVEAETAEMELAPCCEERGPCCDDGGDCCPV